MTIDASRARRGLIGRLADYCDDSSNPIVVKELRQALRGKYFTVIFWLTLGIATTIGAMHLVVQAESPSGDSGQGFFLSIFGCLVFAICLFVPFSAFLSLSSEWDEDTHDMLVISRLTSWQIVRGKFLGSFALSLLYSCAFVPFLAFAFLLRGLDLEGALWGILIALGTSCGLIAVALALSSTSQKRLVRVFLMATLGVFLSYVSVGLTAFVGFTVLAERMHQSLEGKAMILGYLSFVAAVGLFALASSAAKLAHPEENRSSAMRVLSTVALIGGLAWGAWFYSLSGGREVVSVLGVLGAVWITVTGLTFMTEAERLGRRVRLGVPRNTILSLFATPWFPGGGRGVLGFLVQTGFLVFAIWLLPQVVDPAAGGYSPSRVGTSTRLGESALVALVLCGYGFVFTALPTALVSRWTRLPFWRTTGRVAALLFGLGALFGPSVLGLLTGHTSLRKLNHPGNPAWVAEGIFGGKDMSSELGLLLFFVLLTLAVNSPRIWKGFSGMRDASHYRREVEARQRQVSDRNRGHATQS